MYTAVRAGQGGEMCGGVSTIATHSFEGTVVKQNRAVIGGTSPRSS